MIDDIDDIDDFPIFDPVGFEPGERENHDVGPGDIAAFAVRPHQRREVMAQRLDVLRFGLDHYEWCRLIDFGDWFAISDALRAARPLLTDDGQSAETFAQAGEDVTSLVAAFCLGQVAQTLRGHALWGWLMAAHSDLSRCDDVTAPAPECIVDRVSQVVSDAAVRTNDATFRDFRLGSAALHRCGAMSQEPQTFGEMLGYVGYAIAALSASEERL